MESELLEVAQFETARTILQLVSYNFADFWDGLHVPNATNTVCHGSLVEVSSHMSQ